MQDPVLFALAVLAILGTPGPTAASSFAIVPTALASASVAPLVGAERVTVKVSSASLTRSPATLRVIVLLNSFAAKDSVPARVGAAKSAALAPVAPPGSWIV